MTPILQRWRFFFWRAHVNNNATLMNRQYFTIHGYLFFSPPHYICFLFCWIYVSTIENDQPATMLQSYEKLPQNAKKFWREFASNASQGLGLTKSVHFSRFRWKIRKKFLQLESILKSKARSFTLIRLLHMSNNKLF